MEIQSNEYYLNVWTQLLGYPNVHNFVIDSNVSFAYGDDLIPVDISDLFPANMQFDIHPQVLRITHATSGRWIVELTDGDRYNIKYVKQEQLIEMLFHRKLPEILKDLI